MFDCMMIEERESCMYYDFELRNVKNSDIYALSHYICTILSSMKYTVYKSKVQFRFSGRNLSIVRHCFCRRLVVVVSVVNLSYIFFFYRSTFHQKSFVKFKCM